MVFQHFVVGFEPTTRQTYSNRVKPSEKVGLKAFPKYQNLIRLLFKLTQPPPKFVVRGVWVKLCKTIFYDLVQCYK